ncbi:MAG TPA: alpha/beta hydrolase [Bryobacteraceae bacterium]|nr:alpha/beta hydrolase [Bryobacteraceae bacterium]
MKWSTWLAAMLLVPGLCAAAERARPGKNALEIRGQRQEVYYLPARNLPTGPAPPAILFAPGDGGWRGLAVEIAETMASWGHPVFGIDTKRYLESFTQGKATLNEKQITDDMAEVGRWAIQGLPGKLIFVGWSEGAGLGVLALGAPENRLLYQGLIAVGLPERAEMGWRWADNITYITKKDPDEPMFATAPLLGAIAPAPLYVLQSTGDEYAPPEVTKRIFAGARQPKRLEFVEAHNHRFDGNRDAFYKALREGIGWIGNGSHSLASR